MNHIDHIYCLNLSNRQDRWKTMEAKFRYFNWKVERWSALPGSLFQHYWSLIKNSSSFVNSNYIGCALSHLAIYRDALNRGYQKVAIIEDDVGIHRDIEMMQVRNDYDLLYWGWIPLSDDLQRWDYNLVQPRNFQNIVPAKNMWGLFGYVISEKLMKHLLDTYNQEMKYTLDEYLVKFIQTDPKWKVYAYDPQCICTYDGFSDNSLIQENGLLQKSIDSRYAKPWEYI